MGKQAFGELINPESTPRLRATATSPRGTGSGNVAAWNKWQPYFLRVSLQAATVNPDMISSDCEKARLSSSGMRSHEKCPALGWSVACAKASCGLLCLEAASAELWAEALAVLGPPSLSDHAAVFSGPWSADAESYLTVGAILSSSLEAVISKRGYLQLFERLR